MSRASVVCCVVKLRNLTFKSLLAILIADALDFAEDASSVDIPSIPSKQAKPTRLPANTFAVNVDMREMELLLVFVVEFATGAGIVMASSWLLTMSEVTAVLYWFYEYVFVVMAIGFAVVWTVLIYNPSNVLVTLLCMQGVSVIGHTCILCTVVLFFLLFSALSYDNDKTRWIHASFLEPAFQYQSLELVQVVQLVASLAFVAIMLVGFVFLRAQFLVTLKSSFDAVTTNTQSTREASMQFVRRLALQLQNFSIAPYLRFACMFNVVFQEYLLNVLHRVCDDLGECRFNVAVIPVPSNSDIMVLFVIYSLCFLVLECLIVYHKIKLEHPLTQHDTTPFSLGFIFVVHVAALAFLVFFYLPEQYAATSLFNTILWLAATVWYAFEIVPLYWVQTCDATTPSTPSSTPSSTQHRKKNL